jgi:Domain of unknown function (DUF4118)/GAF domain
VTREWYHESNRVRRLSHERKSLGRNAFTGLPPMNMGFGRRPPVQGILVAVFLIALVTSIKLFGEPVIGRTRFLLYTTAVLLSALIGGRNAGLVATSLGALATAYFFIPMRQLTLSENLASLLQLSLFVAEGCLVSLIVSSLDNSRFWLNEGAVKSSALLKIASRSRDRIRAENQKLAGLVELYRASLTAAEPTQIVDGAVNLLADHMGANFVEILERSPIDGLTFVPRAGFGWREGVLESSRPSAAPGTRVGLLLAGSESIIVEDFRVENRFEIDPLLAEHGVFGGMTVPIENRGRVVGLIGVHTDHRERFSRADVEFVKSVAEVLGRAFAKSTSIIEVA